MELIIEPIVSKFACLNINEAHENVINEPDNALVPFVGGGVMVPYSGPPEVRKTKKPRAKVDLADESERVWNLLMGKQSNVGEGTDADVEQWWENERQIFLDRTASFTARMHLIQGILCHIYFPLLCNCFRIRKNMNRTATLCIVIYLFL